MADLVDTANQRGTKTLIAVGSDDTFVRLLAELRGKDFALGFIPLVEQSFLAKIFGISSPYEAVYHIQRSTNFNWTSFQYFSNAFGIYEQVVPLPPGPAHEFYRVVKP